MQTKMFDNEYPYRSSVSLTMVNSFKKKGQQLFFYKKR